MEELNTEQNNPPRCQCSTLSYCPTCFPIFTREFLMKIIRTFLRELFCKSTAVRCLSSIVLFTTAIMWLGFTLDVILYIIFVPFSYSSNTADYKLFGWMCAMVPGIVHFSAHYFWFLTQLAFHCYRKEEIPAIETSGLPREKCTLLLYIDQWIELYRVIILTAFLWLMWFQPWDDLFNIIFVPLGRLSVYLVVTGHVVHLLGAIIFLVQHSILSHSNSNNNDTNNNDSMINEMTSDHNKVHGEKNERNPFWYLSVIIGFAAVLDYWSPQHLELIWYTILFIIYRFFFMNFWTPDRDSNVDCCCCANRSVQDLMYTSNIAKVWFITFSRSSKIVRKNQQFYDYKLFIMIVLRLLLTSMSFVLTDIHYSWCTVSYVLFFIIFCCFWLPPVFNTIINNQIIKWHLQIIQLFLILMFSILVIGIMLIVLNFTIDKFTGVCSLLCPLIYSFSMFIYHVYHYFHDLSIKDYSKSGIILWNEKHDKINTFGHTHNYMYLFLIFIAFFGIAFSNSLYLQQAGAHQLKMDTYVNKSGTFKINTNVDQYRLEACHWEFESLNIVDMLLFASLAYMPTERIKSEIETFYNRTNLQIEFDDEYNTFQPRGLGEITYYTMTTPTAVLVSIRGTQIGYEWLVDFDIWSESVINQIMSVLFPWSRLYPHYLNKLITRYMSMLERLVPENEQINLSKRFYVVQMITKLKEISAKYPKQRSFILVGHSLGGGLAKLAGIGLNRTNLIVSISGPGITYSHLKYEEIQHVKTKNLNERIFNIVHDRDMVPWADKQEGLIQRITCPKQYNRMQCHAILPMFCNMLQNCGNPRNFTINQDICKP